MKQAFGEAYVDSLRKAYSGRVPERTDFVCYWFEQARSQIEKGHSNRAGLIATSTIKSGINVEVLKRIASATPIFLAWPDRPWLQDGASVRVSIVAFAKDTDEPRIIRSAEATSAVVKEDTVDFIHANLSGGADVLQAQPLKKNAGLAFQGVTPAGPFDVPGAEARDWLDLPNPEGVHNRDVLRPYLTGDELMNHSHDRWIVDFDALPLELAQRYRRPFQYVEQKVLPTREKNNRRSLRERWWLAGESQQAMRRAIDGLPRVLVTSRVAVHRVFAWLEAETLPSNKLAVIAKADTLTYGVLNSTFHVAWAAAIGGRHGMAGDLVYNHSKIFETFPFPQGDVEQQQAIEKAAAYLEQARTYLKGRDAPGRKSGVKLGFTGMYNLLMEYRATGQEKVSGLSTLVDAHTVLDEAVAAAYGWTWPLAEDELLAQLLALNLERAGS